MGVHLIATDILLKKRMKTDNGDVIMKVMGCPFYA